jgi:hypothetical protein
VNNATATNAHYVALVRKGKSSRSWICHDDTGATCCARIDVAVGWCRDAVRATVYLHVDRAAA